MTLDTATARTYRITGRKRTYTEQDVKLYALACGYAANPLDEAELRFVDDAAGPLVAPTYPVVAAAGQAALLSLIGVEHLHLTLHAAQRLEIFSLLPARAELHVDTWFGEIYDRGPGRGAFIELNAEGRLDADAPPLFRVTWISLARGEGGFGGPPPPPSGPRFAPSRAPDHEVQYATCKNQALLYSLTGDASAIHIRPDVAGDAGFPRPILQGLCTYGIAGRAIVASCCGGDPHRLRGLDVRFTAPVLPGDTLITQIWRERDAIRFRTRGAERDLVVLDDGVARLF